MAADAAKAAFYTRHKAQQRQSREVAIVDRQLHAVRQRIAQKQVSIVEVQRQHDDEHERFVMLRSQGKHAAQKKLRQRNAHGRQAKVYRSELAMLVAEEETLRIQLSAAKSELYYVRAEHGYYEARHRYLAAVARLSEVDTEASMHKLRLMQEAGIPRAYSPKEVWHYEYIERGELVVHFFFGGGLSPLGDGDSPDGNGHGHYRLMRGSPPTAHLSLHRDPVKVN